MNIIINDKNKDQMSKILNDIQKLLPTNCELPITDFTKIDTSGNNDKIYFFNCEVYSRNIDE